MPDMVSSTDNMLVIMGLALGIIIGISFFKKFLMSGIIEKRAKNIAILNYDSNTNSFFVKDSTVINNGDFHYLKYGTTKNY